MSATHMGNTSRSRYFCHFRLSVPCRLRSEVKSYVMARVRARVMAQPMAYDDTQLPCVKVARFDRGAVSAKASPVMWCQRGSISGKELSSRGPLPAAREFPTL